MRQTRLLLVLLALGFALLLALLRPLPGRAEEPLGSKEPNPTSVEDPPSPPPLPGVASETRAKPRRLASSHRAHHALAFGLRVVRYAKHLLGVPYRYGGASPSSGFDCSGFVRYVYAHFGISLPHSSFADLLRGRRVGRRQIRPGDLVFFDGAGHVGIYVGHDRFIHAPHTGTVVRIETMSGWYGARYTGARRLH